ncbi:hypothetical protein [Mycobacterium sp. HNNTM2301]|uniref:hypothetical protein n=1 Tax=Mycobacterium hainanense TaxID=3289775 RepID=UPI0035A678EF
MLTSIAPTELADATSLSLMFPSTIRTELVISVRGDVAGAQHLEASSGLTSDTADNVARAILSLIRSSAERADRVPVEAGRTLTS